MITVTYVAYTKLTRVFLYTIFIKSSSLQVSRNVQGVTTFKEHVDICYVSSRDFHAFLVNRCKCIDINKTKSIIPALILPLYKIFSLCKPKIKIINATKNFYIRFRCIWRLVNIKIKID